jgi:hypothetical protein
VIAGGIITVIAGVIARKWVPESAGCFSLPGHIPASTTLIEKHDRHRNQKRGPHCKGPGTDAAAIDGLGAAI